MNLFAGFLMAVLATAVASDAPPTVVRREAPRYTARARRAGLEGLVVVEVELDARGAVTDARAVASQFDGGRDPLLKRALELARRWTFSPADIHDVPRPTTALVPLTFSADPDEIVAQTPERGAVLERVPPRYTVSAEGAAVLEAPVAAAEDPDFSDARLDHAETAPAGFLVSEGSVFVDVGVAVDIHGAVTDAWIVWCGEVEPLAGSAIEAARGSAYEAARRNGEPAPGRLLVPIEFTLP